MCVYIELDDIKVFVANCWIVLANLFVLYIRIWHLCKSSWPFSVANLFVSYFRIWRPL